MRGGHRVTLRQPSSGFYPHVDNMCYAVFYPDRVVLTDVYPEKENWPGALEAAELRRTDGGKEVLWRRPPWVESDERPWVDETPPGEMVWSEWLERHIPVDEAVWSCYHQSYLPRRSVVWSRHFQDYLIPGLAYPVRMPNGEIDFAPREYVEFRVTAEGMLVPVYRGEDARNAAE